MNRLRAIILCGLLLPAIAACSFKRTEANEWGCSFGAGPLDSRALKGAYGPGSGKVFTNDKLITGPADIRFYIIDEDPATADFGGRPIIVPARGSSDEGVGVVQVSIETQVRFVFNERFCDWYVDHGRRSEPLNFKGDDGEGSGWNQFLNTSFNQKLIEGSRPVVAGQDYISLFVNAPIGDELAYDVLAKRLSANLSRELIKDLGGEYFCGPSYVFDGKVDGELENGCPPLEVTIKRIAPTEKSLVTKLEQIVANEEQARVIESDKELQLQQIAAQQATQTAEERRRQQVETAKAQADLEIERARQEVLEQEQINADIEAISSTAFCRELAEFGESCALLKAAEHGSYPRILLGDQADNLSVLVNPGE